jgi:transcriptional regulator with XRE-family HTH domain
MGQRIRELRDAHGLTQEQLAHEVGVTVKAVYMWERGTRTPHLKQAARLADILGCTIDELAGSGATETAPKKKGGK